MIKKKYLLFISVFLLICSVIFLLPIIETEILISAKIKQLLTIIITIVIQIFFLFVIRERYRNESTNLYFFHPIFFINVVTILYFFAPFVFFLFNEELFYQRWCGNDIFAGTFLPLTVFCLSVISFNFVCYWIDRLLLSKEEKFFNMPLVVSNLNKIGFKIWIIFYIIIWIMRICSLFTGYYWHSFVTESIIAQKIAFSRFTSTIAFFVQEFSPVVWFVFFFLLFTKYGSNKKYKFFLIFFVFMEMMFYFPSGSKFVVLIPIFTYFFTGLFLRKNIKKQLITFIIIFVLFLPIHNRFRLTGKINLQTIKNIHFLSKKGYSFSVIQAVFKRGDAFSTYFAFKEQCENFLYGKTYLPVLTAFIPRPIWPGKPAFLNVNKIGRKFGLIAKLDFLTSPGIGIWGEAFFNFGYAGLFLMWIFLSLFFMSLFKFMLKSKDIFFIALYYYCPFWFFTKVHAFIGGLFSSIIKMFLIFTILKMVIESVEKRRSYLIK